ncbi:hypothetical protein KO533_17175 [Shewanella sp. NKUCC05_KAH]|uniref:hypothetical protein n=1 Tax=unclassified Shewanella TaxID=196818 RepID=UPI0018E356D1|nr:MULTISPECIES: hypothetical protein [unclassified Shewanella]MBI1676296.1 hypothetical protein [Shewanella sp. DW31]MBW3528282.1 hypothetical protein [Shewanella sp. NKUCC05_KAH]
MLTATLWVAAGVITAAFITRGVKISEFRQAWIDGLREDISEYTCKAHQWIDLYLLSNQESDQQKKSSSVAELDRLKYDALHIHSRISLRFKPDDVAANNLLSHLLDLLDPSKTGLDNNAYSNWRDLLDKIVLEARVLLKEEWETTKNPFRKLYKKA